MLLSWPRKLELCIKHRDRNLWGKKLEGRGKKEAPDNIYTCCVSPVRCNGTDHARYKAENGVLQVSRYLRWTKPHWKNPISTLANRRYAKLHAWSASVHSPPPRKIMFFSKSSPINMIFDLRGCVHRLTSFVRHYLSTAFPLIHYPSIQSWIPNTSQHGTRTSV